MVINCFSGAQLKSGEQSNKLENVENGLQGRFHTHPLFFAITMGLLAEVINSR